MTRDEICRISILEYLSARGFSSRKNGSLYFAKSPFSRDSNWSLCVYPTNTFYDWSQGFGGTIIDLVIKMENCTASEAIKKLSEKDFPIWKPNYKEIKAREGFYKDFEYTKYLSTDEKEISTIQRYALSRGWKNGFESVRYYDFNPEKDSFIPIPSVGFVHKDTNLKPIGIKFRNIDSNGPRFSARGKMGFYILENVNPDNPGEPSLYMIEGEGNANSLWQYLSEIGVNCVVMSCGGVGQFPKELPDKYKNLKEKKLIIDYDGDEELYLKRLENYKEYELTPIKMRLDKGIDINHLYSTNNMEIITNLL